MKILISLYTITCFFIACNQVPTSLDKNNSETIKKIETPLQEESKSDLSETEIESKACNQTEIHVYLNDPDESGTNIRERPKGKIITQLIKDDRNHDYFLIITEAEKGWFKIK
ncbi:MAG: hypothetical protein ACRBFS_10240, partial [Aureispira sp.]